MVDAGSSSRRVWQGNAHFKYLNYSETDYKKTEEYFSIIIFAMSIL